MVNEMGSSTSKRQNIREAILDAMGSLIQRMGYHKTTVEDVANEVGIGKGSVYLHFASKEAIALDWLERMHACIFEKLEADASGTEQPSERAVQFLRLRVLLRFDQFVRYPLSVEQMMATLHKELGERKERFHARERALLASLLAEIDGKKTEECLPFAKAMIIASNALLPYSLRPEQMGNRATVEDNASTVAKLLVTGYIYRNTDCQ
jgi:AcrR family transcriptional regulator